MTANKNDETRLEKELAELKNRLARYEEAQINLNIGESQFTLLTENAVIGIYFIRGTELVYANRSLAKIFGYSPDEMIGKLSLRDIIHPDDFQFVMGNLQARMGGKRAKNTNVTRAIKKDGTVIYIEVFGILTEYGGNPSVMGTVLDVTEQKKAEIELIESEKKYRMLFENANDAIFLMKAGVFVDCNSKTLEMFGCDKTEIIGKSPFDLSPEIQIDGRDSRSKAMEKIQAAHGGEPQRFEWIHNTADGSIFFAEVSLNRVSIDNDEFLLAIVRDISERKKAEQALAESEERFRALTENSQDVIMRFDREKRHLYVNPAVEKQTGIPPADFIGKTHAELGFPEELCRTWESAIERVFVTGKRDRIEFQLPNGVFLDWLLMPEFDEGKNVTAVISSARDISEKRQFELKEKMFLRTERLASFGGLASAIAHEIRQPLNLIKVISDTYLFLKAEKNAGALAGIDIKQNMEEVSQAVERINKIITNLQALMKDPRKIERTPQNINGLLDDIMQFYRQKLANNDVTLEMDLDREIEPIPVSAVQFQEIVTNLVNNAMDAMRNAETNGKRIRITTKDCGDSLSLEVADNGPGVDDSLKGKIFDPLFSTKKEEQSMGLGLYIVQTIVKSMGGNIKIMDNEYRGATFRVTMKKP